MYKLLVYYYIQVKNVIAIEDWKYIFMILIKHLQMNKILVLNNPLGVVTPLNKQKKTRISVYSTLLTY